VKVRVKTTTPHTVREFVVEADTRDAGWIYVRDHLDELTPEREAQHRFEEVCWASEEPA